MEELLRSVLLYSLLVSASLASHALSPLQSDAEALISFRRTIEKDPHGVLQNWSSDNPCFWTGVNCSEGRVVALDLSNAGLVGFLQLDLLMTVDNLRSVLLQGNGFYGNLSSIKTPSPCSFVVVDLSDNNFTANIPAGFLLPCTKLVSLNLSNNFITGGIYPYSPSVQVLDLSQNQFSDNALLNYSFSNCQNLTFFNFSGNKLAGHLDSGIASCNNLVMLDLSYNLISEQLRENFLVRYCVPENCSMVGALQVLNLSHNNISGEFSDLNFGDCGSLRVLDLSYNGFSGKFPATLKNCQRLEILDLSGNSLGPEVPTLLGNLRSLHHLSLRKNHFYGEIPPELGHTCGTLKKLDLSYNNITGNIPSTFTSCSSLQNLELRNNQFSGELLSGVISTITSLRYLCLSFNNITGTVPLSLSNFTKLEVLDLSSNNFTGTIPSGFCSGLSALLKIFLASNFLGGFVPSELGKCKNLRTVDFSFNLLSGPVPPEIWALPELNDLVLWANNIDGMIPDTLCDNGQNLQTLILNNNFIKGAIPSTLASCTNLTWLSLANNQLTGPIPPGIGNLEKLAIVQLFNNFLTGNIPPELGNCRSMIWLDLNSNNLTGPLPPELAKQTGHIVAGAVSGKEFAFVRNEGGTSCRGAGGLLEFAGIRPGRLETYSMMLACPNTRIYVGTADYMFNDSGSMIFLDLAYNSLSGTIPEAFGSMAYLQVFNLGHNRFTGTIPDSFGGLKAIGALDLSYNELHGGIPGSLGGLSFLSDLDVSNNNLSGPIPSSGQLMTFPASKYANNSGLCGIPLPACGSRSGSMTGSSSSGSNSSRRKRSLAVGAVIGIAVSLFIIIGLSFALWKMQRQQKQEDLRDKYIESLPTSGTSSWKICGVPEPLSINVATFERPLRKLTFAHLLEATNGFSAESLIGSGGFGEVYKAQLKDGCTVAIKKLIQVTGQGDREFTAEMETIGKIKHRNLVPLLGYCKIGEERLLVYEYMKWGSLDMVLHDRTKRIARLDWPARKKIAIGSARGLAFLHHSCIPHIIHRDMKSSNVLLDENLEARVSDFGMARLVNALDTHLSVSTLAGTPGYVPPEYYQSFRCTTRGDVYSYGVILLELISGKKPIDTEEFGDNNLVGWAKQLVTEKKANEIFDPELLHQDSDEAELYQYLKIAGECLDERPLRRPTMIQVMAMFKELQIDSESDFLDGFSVGDTVIDETSP